MDDKDWMSPSEAARRLGRSADRIRQMIREGKLNYKWTPLGRLVDRHDVERLRSERELLRVTS